MAGDQALDRGVGRSQPHHRVRTNRTHTRFAVQRFADDAAGKRRRRRVGTAGANADRGQAQGAAVNESLPRVVSEQQLANRLLHPVRVCGFKAVLSEISSGKSPPNTATELVKTTRGRLPAARQASSSRRVASTLMRIPRSKSASAIPLTMAARWKIEVVDRSMMPASSRESEMSPVMPDTRGS